MNILYVLPYFNPKRGGDVNVCANLAREFVKRGHEVTILTTDFELDVNYLNYIEEQGINVVHSKVLFNLGLFIYSPEMKKWLNKNISNFDIIHLHTFRAYQNNIIHEYSKKYKVPYILQAHGSVLPFFQKQKLKKVYDHIWGYKLLQDASKVIALTETELEQYKEMKIPENKIKIVPNGINLSEYQDLPKKGEFRKKYGIKDDDKVILYLGRLNKTKGIDLLIKSFSEISKELNKVKLVIAGPDDGFLSALKELSNNLMLDDNILFTGPIYKTEKMAAYVDASVFVTPSFSGFPMTFLESCACGTPVVTTNKGDELNWITNIGYTIQYEKNSLKDTLVKILKNDELLENLSEKCSKFVQVNFNLEITINKFQELYEKVLNAKKKPNLGILTFPASGPNTVQLLNLVKLFVPLSDGLYVITGNESYETLKDSPKVFVYGVNHDGGFLRIFRYFLTQLKLSYQFLKVAPKADFWIFMGGETLILPVSVSFLLRTKLYLLLIGCVENEFKMKKDMNWINSYILSLFKKITLSLTFKIIVYSPILIKKWDLSKYEDKVLVAHEHFLNPETIELKSLSERSQIIGYIGRLSEEKGIINFVKSMPAILEELNVKFLIGGNGPLLNEVKAYIKDNGLEEKVICTGWISHDEIYEYLNKLKLLVLPSYTEGLPNIILEAMACGTPVLSTPVGAVPDLIKDEETGFIMENNSPSCIAKNVIKVFKYEDVDKISENAFDLIKKEYSYKSTLNKWKEILGEING